MYPRSISPQLALINEYFGFILVVLALSLSIFPSMASAEVAEKNASQLSMTLTPPLYQITLAREASWSSNLKFVNNNPYDMLVYVSVENFRADGETGIVFMTPSLATTTNSYELAKWVTLPAGAMKVLAGKTYNIPFTLRIPKNAEPGGHYAAIMVGTQPPNTQGGIAMATQVSSLLIVRVAGEVIESGFIRDFSPEQALVNTQKASFAVRFENTGNVHLKPEGLITIYNMFGRERGQIIINKTNTFGNVLPMSARKFSFGWVGERNFFDIGRYRAKAELTFGEDGRKSARYTTHFWVIPLIPLISILGSLTFFIWFVRMGVRRYVRSAVRIEEKRRSAVKQELVHGLEVRTFPHDNVRDIPMLTFAILRQPLVEGALDLSGRSVHKEKKGTANIKIVGRGASRTVAWARYAPFFIFVMVFLVGLSLIGWYFYQVFESERNYEMILKKDGAKDVVVRSLGQ